MRRREIILAIGALSVAGSDAIAQQGTRLYRIGVLSPEVPLQVCLKTSSKNFAR